ncbi:Glucan synthase-like 1 isoform 1 [Hibiscus syriacus]|uniref:RING-type E3 ubiquitin transferase n=1 Tax=Hibiscus syriacus TaxID=106335 RepID=A0A6A3BSW5_HIBSY|nr:uncharacterized protein LOC120210484 [Hibiscus syriacus]KAE8719926.1 Glucan synthase-like 1 isoform 1 [Hibiscus syriacus]
MKPPELIFYPKSHSKTHNFHPTPFLFVAIVFLLQIPKAISSIAAQIPLEYVKRCNDVVPASTAEPSALSSSSSISHDLDFKIGYYTGGDSIFSQLNPATDVLKSATFHARFSQDYLDSNKNRIHKVNGKLVLQTPKSFAISSPGGGVLNPRRGLRRTFRIRGPKIPSVVDREMQRFSLGGFWSESTGRLCMIGSGMSNGNAGKFRTFNVVLKLNYSTTFNVSGSLISGVLQSLDSEHSSSYFEPVSLLGVRSFGNYEFSLVDNGQESSCLSEGENLDVSKANGGLCSVNVHRRIRFGLDYEKDCDQDNCSSIIRDVKDAPSIMFFRQTKCVDEGKMLILLDFRNSSSISAFFPFDPNTTLIAEGAWDEKKNGVCGVACRVLNFRDSLNGASVGECSIKFSLRYPKVFSLRNRDSIVGKIWSDKSKDDPSYFDMIRLRSVWEVSPGLKNVPGLRYEYTEVASARKIYVSKNVAEHKGKTYPNGDSIDMRFEMLLIDSEGEAAWGVANPLFVGDQPYKYQPYGLLSMSNVSADHLSNNDGRLLNISYEISYSYRSSDGRILDRGFVISSEGIYDRHSGVLCMVGCSQLQVRYKNHSSIKNDSLDCDILVTAQFSPLNSAEKYRVKGTIKSTRIKSDPRYFGPISLSSKSFYAGQAKESIWRMDLEITMVLVSNTLACLFVGLQLFHVKKHSEVLPFISVLMLIVLTLGHMIPLLLNFEALFVPNHNQQQNAFLQSGGWLEVNEIIVRAVTMVAFLLQFRLLQLTWSERQSYESLKGLWEAERKVLYISLPLYLTGVLIAWFVHLWKNTHQTPFLQPRQRRLPFKNNFYQQSSFWSDLKSYGGSVVDGFLLPQIVFNMFSNSNKNALAASFYLGTTLVRLLPHAYDLYRAHSFSGYLDLSYIYANHKMDLYSTAWDIIIPSGGLLFSIFISLQQRFGGQCLLPKRFRTDAVYEKVSVDNSEELQGESVQKNFYSL